jgi:hypothetical protein
MQLINTCTKCGRALDERDPVREMTLYQPRRVGDTEVIVPRRAFVCCQCFKEEPAKGKPASDQR